jgi:hypothetical protein
MGEGWGVEFLFWDRIFFYLSQNLQRTSWEKRDIEIIPTSNKKIACTLVLSKTYLID